MKKILVVDDDRDLLEMVETALTEEGFEVHTSGEGKTFFDQIQNVEPDAILLDVFLKDADGRELCSQLKSDPELKHIPVALYSAGHMNNATIINSKANLYITKPFNIKQLGEKLKGMLSMNSKVKNLKTHLGRILQSILRYRFKSQGYY